MYYKCTSVHIKVKNDLKYTVSFKHEKVFSVFKIIKNKEIKFACEGLQKEKNLFYVFRKTKIERITEFWRKCIRGKGNKRWN